MRQMEVQKILKKEPVRFKRSDVYNKKKMGIGGKQNWILASYLLAS